MDMLIGIHSLGRSIKLCMQLDLAKLVPSGREQGLEDKLRGLQE